MTKFLFSIFLVFCAFLFRAEGQQLTIQIDEPFLSAGLSGLVMARDLGPLPGATVERMGKEWKNVIDTRSTDLDGRFNFHIRRPGMYFLRLSSYGFQTYKVKVLVSRGKRKPPRFVLEVGT